MPVSSINSASNSYSAAASNNDAASAARPAAAGGSQSSTVVTLSDGTNSNVVERDTSTLKATPLAVLRSPEMLVQGDSNQDKRIDADEFGKQLARIGVSAEDARQLFATFDASGDGKVTPEEYIQGVKDSLAGGSSVFKDLLNSYINGADGHLDFNAYSAFMQKGKELAAEYVKQSGNER